MAVRLAKYAAEDVAPAPLVTWRATYSEMEEDALLIKKTRCSLGAGTSLSLGAVGGCGGGDGGGGGGDGGASHVQRGNPAAHPPSSGTEHPPAPVPL